ncbi:unnamed protein product [Mucor hiemalis]
MNNDTRDQLPKHLPVDMAIAPDQKPYQHTHVIHTSGTSPQSDKNKLAQHSLSPEKLGLVGYVKDVAGFVKDAVHERREKNAIARRSSASSVTSVEKQDIPVVEEKERRRSSAEHHPKPPSSPFAEAITGLFPGVSSIGDANAAGCTHADDLRNQMMQVNEHQHDNSGRKLL